MGKGDSRVRMRFESQLLQTCVTLAKLLSLSELQYWPQYNRSNYTFHQELSGLNEINIHNGLEPELVLTNNSLLSFPSDSGMALNSQSSPANRRVF